MLNKSEELTFSSFYFIEFFNQVLRKGKNEIPQAHYDKLEELGGYLVNEQNLIEGLEKLANYQGTNEFSIFLFDMIDRLEDFAPDMVYGTLPELTSDFINLYNLMLEDTQSIEAVEAVISDFRSEGKISGKEKAPAADVPEMLTFSEFYQKEVFDRLGKKLDTIGSEKQKTDYLALVDVCSAFIKSGELKNSDQYDPNAVALAGAMNRFMPDTDGTAPAEKLMEKLDEHIDDFAGRLEKFADKHETLFKEIIETQKIPGKKKAPPEKVEMVQEEVPAEPLTIDKLLQEYFLSDVEDHIDAIRTQIDMAKQSAGYPDVLKNILKQFKSLKEISMIHGFNGIEHLANSLINVIRRAIDEDAVFGKESENHFESIFDALRDIERFTTPEVDEEALAEVEAMIGELEASFASPEREAKEEPAEEKAEAPAEKDIEATKPDTEEVEPEIEPEIPFTDKKTIYAILKDLLRKIQQKVFALHDNLDEEQVNKEIIAIIQRVRKSGAIVNNKLATQFFDPLTEAYQKAAKLEKDERRLATTLIETTWQHFITLLDEPADFSSLKEKFESIAEIGAAPEETIAFSDERRIAEILTDTARRKWAANRSLPEEALLNNDDAAREQLIHYFRSLIENLVLGGFTNHAETVEYIIGIIENSRDIGYDKPFTAEIDKTLQLLLDRIKNGGRGGNSEDILSVLKELVEEYRQPEPEEKEAAVEAESPPAEEPEEDLEEIFRQESETHGTAALKALDALGADTDNREPFNVVEKSIHNIRSSAYLLKNQQIGDLAALIEDIAEFYRKATIPLPENLIADLKNAVLALMNKIKDDTTDIESTAADLQVIFDRIMLEDSEPEREAPAPETDSAKEEVEEKPLFAEKEEVDEDMLEIFQQEAKNFIGVIEQANLNLLKNLDAEEELDKLESAAHSLKSAAKMMGFREIGQVTDSLENIIEAIKADEISNSVALQESIKEAVAVVKKISAGQKVTSAELARVINILDISDLKSAREAEMAEAAGEEEAPEVLTKKDVEQVNKVFVEEARNLIKLINDDLLELEKMPESEPLLSGLQRNLHTLKGSALMVGFEKIGNLSHKLEDYFQIYKLQAGDVKHEMINPIFSAIDLIEEMVDSIKDKDSETAAQFTARLAEIDNKLFLYQNFDQQLGDEKITQPSKTSPAKSRAKADDDNMIKITTAYLDNLVNMATELVVNRTELAAYFENLKTLISGFQTGKKDIYNLENILEDLIENREYGKESGADARNDLKEDNDLNIASQNFRELIKKLNNVFSELNKLSQGFEQNIGRIANITKELHSDILKARLLPIENLFNRYPRSVRDLAKENGKKVSLVIEGNDAEMDRAMIESLTDPLMHILRNAVDHGIEKPAERRKLGKKETGTIALRARQEKNQVVIDIEDDGRGIDLDEVKKAIIKHKLAAKKDVEKMSEAEILSYIYYSEFSTREKASDVSGRGIGLDVVANQIQKLKGIIRIKTEKNSGTTFSIRVPLTLVISQALIIKMNAQPVAIPIVAVQQTMPVDHGDILFDDERKYIQVRGKLLPFAGVDELLKIQKEEDRGKIYKQALILHDAGVSIALGVDEIIGRQEIVIKSLGSHLQNVDYIAGGTILGDGSVALILDYAAVIRTIEFQFFGSVSDPLSIRSRRQKASKEKPKTAEEQKVEKYTLPAAQQISKTKIKGRKPRILIVDDSSSVRNFVSNVLEKQGYTTLKSSNGAAAIDVIENEIVDLVITDLEMPKMHGFALITLIRQQEKFNKLPVVILTGKTGQQQRRKGKELGANAFIVKPFKENDLLNVIADFIEV